MRQLRRRVGYALIWAGAGVVAVAARIAGHPTSTRRIAHAALDALWLDSLARMAAAAERGDQ